MDLRRNRLWGYWKRIDPPRVQPERVDMSDRLAGRVRNRSTHIMPDEGPQVNTATTFKHPPGGTEGIYCSEGVRRYPKDSDGPPTPNGGGGETIAGLPAEPDIRQSAWDYTLAALAWAEAYRRSPGKPEWQTGVFHFVRLLKGHPDIAASNPTAVADWLTKHRPTWAGTFGCVRRDLEMEFFQTWGRVRLLPGADPLTMAKSLSDGEPLKLHPSIEASRPEGYREFISVVGWLCVVVGKAQVTIPCREFADVLSCGPITISRYRTQAKTDGYLKLTKNHRMPAAGQPGEATRFRFAVERFPLITAKLDEQKA